MKAKILSVLVALLLAGLYAVPALAGDGDGAKGEKPSGEAKGECEDDDGDDDGEDDGEDEDDGEECDDDEDCDEGEKCEKCEKGAKDGAKERAACCKEKAARTDLEVVTLAAVEGASDAAKKVLAAVPPEAMKKVEEARRAAFDRLAEIQKTMAELHADFRAACAESKEKGKEVACEMKATYEKDMKVLKDKAKEQYDSLARTIQETIGEEKVKALSADCRKAGDMARAATLRIKAAAAKLLERKKAEEKEAEEEKKEGEKEGEKKDAGAPAGPPCKTAT